jgi:dipeptidase E
MKYKHPVFMPSQGLQNTPQEFLDDWEDFTKEFNLEVKFIDNTVVDSASEKEKLKNSNILIISGGDPFQLLLNLRKTGLDSAIIQFTKKDEFILAGYSAGAYVLTPTLEIAKIFNENYPGGKKYLTQDIIEDFTGLGIVDFEVCTHYSEMQHKHVLEKHIENSKYEVKLIADNDYIIIDL